MARIREMRGDDIATVAEILYKSGARAHSGETKENLHQMLLDSLGRFSTFVAEDSGEISGAACFIPERILSGGGCLCFLVVREEKRRRGIGRQLMGFIERKVFLKSNSCFLTISSAGDSELEFFGKLGYEKVGELPAATASQAAEWILRKPAPGRNRVARRNAPPVERSSLLAK